MTTHARLGITLLLVRLTGLALLVGLLAAGCATTPEREALLRLRADGAIDDDVLRALERELDLEERRIDA